MITVQIEYQNEYRYSLKWGRQIFVLDLRLDFCMVQQDGCIEYLCACLCDIEDIKPNIDFKRVPTQHR